MTFLDSDRENNSISRLYVISSIVSSACLFILWRKIMVSTWHMRAYGPTGRLIWRNKYPSFEDLYALFDRAEVLMAGILVATTLQLAHKEVARVLETHSMYKTDPWRRLVRTMTFIQITIRAKSAQRSQVVSWLNNIHANIILFAFETNVFILATIAFGFARAHQVLGCVTDVEVDAVVSAIMNMAKTLNPEDRQKWVPTSLSEVENYLSKQINVNPDFLLDFQATVNSPSELLDLRKMKTTRTNATSFFYNPFSWLKLFFIQCLMRDMCHQILSPHKRRNSGLLLSFAQVVQPLWYHLHNNACPRIFTFDGLFDFLFDCDPSLKKVTDEVYQEIFGGLDDNAALTTRRSHAVGPGVELTHSSLYVAILEHFKCAYFRTRLASTAKQIPKHLGIIMDGNRRYSREKRLGSVIDGHRMGARKMLQVISWSISVGINNLTVWALSDDNLKRDTQELESLFLMLAEYIREFVTGDTPLVAQDIRFRVVGDRSLLPEELRRAISAAEAATGKNRRFNLQLALGYGGRAEVMRAVCLATKALSREESISIEEAASKLSAYDVSRFTYSAELGLPEIDAILRTSGEKRLSGFALWETQVAEISFLAANWPDMRQSDFLSSVVDLSGRIRRFGA